MAVAAPPADADVDATSGNSGLPPAPLPPPLPVEVEAEANVGAVVGRWRVRAVVGTGAGRDVEGKRWLPGPPGPRGPVGGAVAVSVSRACACVRRLGVLRPQGRRGPRGAERAGGAGVGCPGRRAVVVEEVPTTPMRRRCSFSVDASDSRLSKLSVRASAAAAAASSSAICSCCTRRLAFAVDRDVVGRKLKPSRFGVEPPRCTAELDE